MKPIFLLLLLSAAVPFLLNAQSETTLRQNFLLLKTQAPAPFERAQADECDQIVAALLAQVSAGGSGAPYSVFGLQPALSLLEEGKMEGVKTLVTAKVNIGFRVNNVVSSENFGAFDLVSAGSGKTRNEAVRHALQQLRSKKSKFAFELRQIEEKIGTYYEQNCASLSDKARNLVEKKDYAAALAILHGIPAESGCSGSAAALTAETFARYQEQQCAALLRQAEALSAGKRFGEALDLLGRLSPSAPCATDANAKIAAIESKADAALKEKWEWLFKCWSAGAEMEKARWNALTAISLGWLRTQYNLDLIEK